MNWILVLVIGYLLGAIPFGYLVGKLYKVDIREHGSGNVGFTNAWRVLGIYPASLVLLGDAAKGYGAAYVGFALLGERGALAGGIIAIIGHTLSCFIHFKGGKGIATGAGVVLFMSPLTLLICVSAVAIITLLTKYMSLGSIVGAAMAPILLYAFKAPMTYTVGIGVACLYVIYMHRANIKRLLNGTENKVGKSKNS